MVTEHESSRLDAAAGEDLYSQVQAVMLESYLEVSEDLRFYAEKLRDLNGRKKAVRRYPAALREFRASVMSAARERGVDLSSDEGEHAAILGGLFEEHARAHEVGDIEYELGVPGRVPPADVGSVALLDEEIARWDEQLAKLTDDSELAKVDLQNMLQKQQQTLQMMSQISKQLHDTAVAVIRKMRG